MKDRFDLETEIMDIYNFASHIRSICKGVLEDNISLEQAANAMEGIAVLLELKSENLTDTMCQVLKLDEYQCQNDNKGNSGYDFNSDYVRRY